MQDSAVQAMEALLGFREEQEGKDAPPVGTTGGSR